MANARAGRHPLVEAHEGDAHDLPEGYPPSQPDRLERRGQPVRDVRIEEHGIVAADHDV